MSLFTTFNPPLVGPGLTSARPKRSQLRSSAHQLEIKEDDLDLKDTTAAVSRRKIMGFAGLSLAMFSLSSPKPAEARMTRAEMKNKIMEKLRELREKVGASKPKDEDEEQTSKPEKDSTPQQEFSNEQKMSGSQEDESREAVPKPEGVDGENSALQTENEGREESIPQNKFPFSQFLNLTEVDLEPLAEANVSR